jgi:hypothetical protein
MDFKGNYYQKIFDNTNLEAPQPTQKYVNVQVNIFLPKDVSVINKDFNLNAILEKNPDSLDRFQYFVSVIGCLLFANFSMKPRPFCWEKAC